MLLWDSFARPAALKSTRSDPHLFVSPSTMSINDLLQAAEFLERVEKDVSDSVSSAKPNGVKNGQLLKRPKGSPPAQTPFKRCNSNSNRAAHNELEKTRRAQLRARLESLKDMVPSSGESSRNTTLSLLTRTRNYIKALEQKDAERTAEKLRLQEQQKLLRRHLQLLTGAMTGQLASTGESVDATPSRPCSESSASTISVQEDLQEDTCIPEERAPSPPSPELFKNERCAITVPNGSKLDGLLPALPLFHPRLSIYPYFCGGASGLGLGNGLLNGAGQMHFSSSLPHIPTVSSMVAVPSAAGVTVLSARGYLQ